MNTFSDRPSSLGCFLNGGNYVTDGMAGTQQSFTSVTTLSA